MLRARISTHTCLHVHSTCYQLPLPASRFRDESVSANWISNYTISNRRGVVMDGYRRFAGAIGAAFVLWPYTCSAADLSFADLFKAAKERPIKNVVVILAS